MILTAKNLIKAYDNSLVIKDVSLSISPGESIAICGRSGEGKTTLLHILGTLEEADNGQIEIGGKILTSSNRAKIRNQKMGFIFQAYNLLDDFTALENVLMPARIGRFKVDRSKGIDLLKLVGLESKAELQAKHLSGGERQRVAIARALCNGPELILADEPSGNLDRANAIKIGEILIDLVKREKKSLILVTHDSELALSCDRKYLLSDGFLNQV